MKPKIKHIFVFLFIIIFSSINLNAKSVLNSKIYVRYNNETKDLYAYGYNMQGNLGTGNFEEVSKNSEIKLNTKIGDARIIDYVFTDAQTFLLTDTGKLYATGYRIGDGNSKSIRTTFRELKLYNSSKTKVKSLNVLFNGNKCSNILNDKNAKCNLQMRLFTNNNNVYYNLNHFQGNHTNEQRVGRWNYTYLFHEYRYNDSASNYIIYTKIDNKNVFYETTFNASGKRLISFFIDKNKKLIIKNNYNNGVIIQSKKMSEKKLDITKYRNGLKISKRINTYENYKKPIHLVDYLRYKTKEVYYNYQKGKVKSIVKKKLSNKKLRLSYKKIYYRNKKGELKSNKNGKAFSIISFYRNGKVIKKNKYLYNSKGKVYKVINLKK